MFDIVDPNVEALISGPKNLGSAFLKIIKVIEYDRENLGIKEKRYFDLLVFVVINGNPSDPELLRNLRLILKALRLRGLVSFVKKIVLKILIFIVFLILYKYKTLNSADL